MLNWIKGDESDHPLADEKQAKELLADLPSDSYKTIEEVGRWLEELEHANSMKLTRAAAIVDELDHAVRAHLKKLQQEYVGSGGRLQKFQETRIWTTTTLFWRRLVRAHLLLLKRFQAGDGGWGSIKDRVPLVAARAARAAQMLLKWQLLRYGPVDHETWSALGYVMAYAEEKNMSTGKVTVYPGSDSTIQREFLKAMMLAMSSTDSLLPHKLEVAERLISHYSDLFALQRKPAKGLHFFVDLGAGTPAARCMARVEEKASTRFFGPGGAAQAMEALAMSVKSTGAIPANMDLGGAHRADVVVETAQHLARYWAAQPPARSEERRRTVSQIIVIHGFDDIVARLSDETQAGRADENWTVENESEGGYGALIGSSSGDWVNVGALIGVKLSDGGSWAVGVVRRVTGRSDLQRYVGIQLLARGAAAVQLRSLQNPKAALQRALLLPSRASDVPGQGEMKLLLREGSFSPQAQFEMLAYGRSYVLLPRQLVEEGADFDIARYRVMQGG
jgi:hypothetical protein